MKTLLRPILFCILSLVFSTEVKAYSVLTHEALIDANWERAIVPLLKLKYPKVSVEELKDAHAYAYGGVVVPDMGYYPTGSQLFTGLLHYVRSGDFIENLLTEAKDVNEYAFALGVLCHYSGDRYGHAVGINTSVPLIYPEIKEHFGDTVTWADHSISHIRTEFSFDVLQTARGAYASHAYQDFIGFKVAEDVLQRAFYKTYALNLDDLFSNLSRTIAIFRWTVSNLLPFITRTAWANKKDQIRDSIPTATAKNFIYRMNVRNYNKQIEKRQRPGTFAYIAAFVIRILPKVGPLAPLKFRQPTIEAEKKFIQSFDSSSAHYAAVIKLLGERKVQLTNIDFDTGNRTLAGQYRPTDISYGEWLLKLQETHFKGVSASIQKDIINFYSHCTPLTNTRREKKDWQELRVALVQLMIRQ